MTYTPTIDDGLRELANRSAQGTSFHPEKRAQQRLEEYRAHLESVRAQLEAAAKTDAGRAVLEERWPDYVTGYRKRYAALLAAQGRTLSPMVTGPAKFPTRRNQRALDAEGRRLEDLLHWSKKAERRIRRAIERAEAPDPREELRRKIEAGQLLHDIMVGCNRILRKNLTEHQKVEAMVELGLGEATARKVLEPDHAGRVGFPSYELTSNRDKLQRMRGRLAALEAADGQDEPLPFEGGEVHLDAEDDRLRIVFEEKPDEAMRARLKASGFRWSRRHGAWQRQLTQAARKAAEEILPGFGS